MTNALRQKSSIKRLMNHRKTKLMPEKNRIFNLFLLTAGLMLVFVLLGGCQTPQYTKIILKSTPQGAVVKEAELGEIGVTDTEYVFDHEQYALGHPGSTEGRCIKSFVFTLPGYESARVNKEITGEEVTVHALLENRKTKLRIKRVPGFAVAKLYHEGMAIDYEGKTPGGRKLSDSSLWNEKGVGIFDVEVTAPGYETVETSVELKKGRKQELSYILKEKQAVVNFISVPEGADVYDRSLGYLGRTPFSIVFPGSKLVRVLTRPNLSLNKAQLQLIFKKKGFRTKELVREIRVGGVRENVVHVNMK